MSWITPVRSGSGGNGSGRRRTIASAVASRRASVEQVERDPAAEAAGADAEAGVAERVGDAAAERRAEEHREAAAGVDRAAPAMAEAQALELRERREEVLRELGERRLVVVELRADRPAVAVDRVVAAPQDPAVGGQPVVVELVADVADALPAGPADRGAHALVERLGHQRVVVDRRDVAADRAHQRRVGARGQQDAARIDDPALGDDRHAGARPAERADRAVLVDAHAGADRRRAQSVGELAGVDERRAGPRPQPAEIRRRVHLRADLLGVEQLGLVAEPAHQLGLLLEVRELVRLERDDQVAGRLELGVDLEPLQVGGERVEVLEPEPLELRRARRGSATGRCRCRG